MVHRRLVMLAVAASVAAGGCDLSASGPSPSPAVRIADPSLHENGPIWFLGGSHPGSLFGRSGPLYRLMPGQAPARTVLPGRVWNVTALAVSPDGGTVALAVGGGEFPPRNLFTVRSDGSHLRKLTSGNFYEVSPSWSPDGRRIVFSSTRCCTTSTSSGAYALYTIARDASDLHRVFDDTSSDIAPSWSPDGGRIAFVREPVDGGTWTIWSVAANGDAPRQLTHDQRYDDAVAWSPDGTRLAYVSHLTGDRDWQIRVMRPGGGGSHTIFRCSGSCRSGGYWLAWSPDATQIAFVVFTGATGGEYRPRLAVIGADGHGYHLIDTRGHSACCLSWVANRG
jgi:dipeptidyl aminopeptidase/acylaminoacyl peptidase